MKNKLKVVYKKVNESPKILEINNTLNAKQKLVGGLIEVVPYFDDVLIICNECGKMLNMKANVIFENDYIAGDFFVVGDDYKNSDFKSLTETQIHLIINDLKARSVKYINRKELCEER